MVRTHARLREDQLAALQRSAAEKDVPMAELIRDAIDLWLDQDAKWERAMSVVGMFRSSQTDVSVRHDDYLAEAYWDDLGRT